jgi:hypothetical protein
MDGRKKVFRWYAASYGPGSYTWIAPKTGYYRFAQWGSGSQGGGGSSGGSGSHAQSVVLLAKGATVAILVAAIDADNTTVTLPTGRVITAASASGATAGVASGGDINISGTNGIATFGAAPSGLGDNPGTGGVGNGTSVAGGAGAPGYGGFRGGNGRGSADQPGVTMPGGGANTNNGTVAGGLVLIVRQNTSTL